MSGGFKQLKLLRQYQDLMKTVVNLEQLR